MGVAWQWLDENPNLSGGCLCFPVNDPLQPKNGGWTNPAREFDDLGYQSPHVFKCCGCPHFPEDKHPAEEAETVDSTAEELSVTIVPAKRKAALATD